MFEGGDALWFPLTQRPNARRTTLVDTPVLFAITRRLAPFSRGVLTVSGLTSRRGRPRTFPFALAFARPAFTRSRMSSRSNWAKAPISF